MSAQQTGPALAPLLPARQMTVDGRPIAVFDGLLPEDRLREYVEALSRTGFRRAESASPESAAWRHWIAEMPLAMYQALPLAALTLRALDALRPGGRWRAYRAYTNLASYGDMLFTHTDCAPDADEFTALWYLCERWEIEWGGETVFFDAEGDALACVSPRPGRLALFHGAIRHAGRPPSRVCPAPRYTLAVKLEAADAPNRMRPAGVPSR